MLSVSPSSAADSKPDLKTTFNQAVGGTFYRQMMSALRSSTGNAAYFDGGQTEKIFLGQFDELMVDKLSQSNGDIFAGDLFEQFQRQRNPTQAPQQAAAAISEIRPGQNLSELG